MITIETNNISILVRIRQLHLWPIFLGRANIKFGVYGNHNEIKLFELNYYFSNTYTGSG